MGTGKRNSTTAWKDAKIRFWSQTRTGDPDACWEFTGDINDKGYGRITIAGAKMYAHRFSYAIHHDIPPEEVKGIILRHTCDNPLCVNPNHLIPGTTADNMQDKVDRNRQRKGESVPGAKLTPKLIVEIRELYKTHSLTQTELARIYGVSLATINDMLLGKTWKHI